MYFRKPILGITDELDWRSGGSGGQVENRDSEEAAAESELGLTSA